MNYLDSAIDDEKPEVNLTSMLDVVFIMLIFFVVTATFIRETGIPVTLPASGETGPDNIETIIVVVESAGTFVVGDRVVSKGGLIPYLTALYSQNPEAGFAIVLTAGSRVKDTVAAADAGRVLGFDVIPVTMKD